MKTPPKMLIHPPWRTMAEDVLKEKDRELYDELKKAKELTDYLDRVVESARQTYETSVKEARQKNPRRAAFVAQSVQEMIVDQILDPTS